MVEHSPGLCFVGLPFLYSFAMLVGGVGRRVRDAEEAPPSLTAA